MSEQNNERLSQLHEEFSMESNSTVGPGAVLQRLHMALNEHNLAAFVSCFGPDYQSEQPVHPGVSFGGRDQVQKNWSAMFSHIPDFRAELRQSAVDGDTVWAEWRWSGVRIDGVPLEMCGVTLFGIQTGQIVWGRLYMEDVKAPGAGIDEQVRNRTQG